MINEYLHWSISLGIWVGILTIVAAVLLTVWKYYKKEILNLVKKKPKEGA